MEGSSASSFIRYPSEIKYDYKKDNKYSIHNDLFQTSYRQGVYTSVNSDMHQIRISNFVAHIIASIKKENNDCGSTVISTDYFNFGENWIGISARALYYQHGIKITHVDSLSEISKLIVENPKDAPSKTDPFFQKARENGNFTDFTFKLKDSEQCFHCHKLILASKSSFFEKYLTGGFQEASSNEITAPEGIDAQTVERMLNFLYTGEISIESLSKEETIQLLTLSKYYALQYLSQLSTDHLRDMIDENNVAELIDFADRLDVEDLKNGCEKFLLANLDKENVEDMALLAEKFQLHALTKECKKLKSDPKEKESHSSQ